MSRIIIGIHGMGNKPHAQQLQRWWKAAILEGLKGRRQSRFLKFQLVYWASILHEIPLDLDTLKEPYVTGIPLEGSGEISERQEWLRDHLNEQLDKIFLEEDGSLNFSHLTDFIIRHFVQDLDAYYNKLSYGNSKESPRELICRQLSETLNKNRRKKILLIAHSMGSIITWDVLTKYNPHVKIDTLVTIGSPLGLPVVRSKMYSHANINDSGGNENPVLKTPENIIKNWYNLSDFKDRVAINYDLNNDFLPNSHMVQPEDILVRNNYEYKNDENHHKSYGYLRCPEMAVIVKEFLRWRL